MIFSSIYTRNYISTYLIIVNVEVVRRAKHGHEGGKVRLGSAVGSVALALRLVRPYHAEQIGANEEIAAGLVATSYKQKKESRNYSHTNQYKIAKAVLLPEKIGASAQRIM